MFFDVLLPAMRRRRGRAFRKRLGVFNYKVGTEHTHKLPGVMPFTIKQNLLKQDTHRARQLIQKMETNSHYPFGKFTRTHSFIFDRSKVPIYNVPDLTGFDLKPYVSVHTPRVEQDMKDKLKALNDWTNPDNFGRFKDTLPATGKETKPATK